MLKKRQSLAVIIPMYNEEKVATRCIDDVVAILKNLPIKSSLIVINDGSFDKTPLILKEKIKTHKNYLKVETHDKNIGYGKATQTGITRALKLGFTWSLHMDSDLTNDPRYIQTFAQYINSKYDCIKASRYIKGSKVVGVPFRRRIISFIGNYIAYVCFDLGIKDCTNGFRMVKMEKLRGITLRENNFSIILEELYYLKKKDAKFIEIPYTLTARNNSKSHFNYSFSVFCSYLKYAIKALLE